MVDALTKNVAGTKDYFETGLPANCGNCGNCDGYHTVVECGDMYFCASCFDMSDRVEQCEWCNEMNTGDMEFSNANGCGQCEGQWGHMKDD